jgi:hypothetical protein|tara:strand:- start:4334 stop:4846 length:513 start_codon:yes stop_codon:yes gene_type:complete
MTQLVLLGLILLWAVVLVPGWVRSARAGRGNRLAMNVWRRQLSVMAVADPRQSRPLNNTHQVKSKSSYGIYARPKSVFPQTVTEAATRRRDIALLLILGSLVSLFGWFAGGGIVVALSHLAFDLVLGCFAMLVLQRKRDVTEKIDDVYHFEPRIVVVGEESQISSTSRRK